MRKQGDRMSIDKPAVPVLMAPPYSKVACASTREIRTQPGFSDLARQSQIQRLDSSHWSEWQFDFGARRGDAGSSRAASAASSMLGSAGGARLPPNSYGGDSHRT